VGAACVFERIAGTWQQTQRLLSTQPNSAAQFGDALAVASDGSLLVGAFGATRDYRYEGAVHVFGVPSGEVFRDGFE